MRGGSIDVSQGVAPGVAPSPAPRALDVVFGAAALLLLSPMILVVALAVRLTSAGPVMFRQVRVGQGGQPFTLYKFRTMRTGTRGPEVTRGKDPASPTSANCSAPPASTSCRSSSTCSAAT